MTEKQKQITSIIPLKINIEEPGTLQDADFVNWYVPVFFEISEYIYRLKDWIESPIQLTHATATLFKDKMIIDVTVYGHSLDLNSTFYTLTDSVIKTVSIGINREYREWCTRTQFKLNKTEEL